MKASQWSILQPVSSWRRNDLMPVLLRGFDVATLNSQHYLPADIYGMNVNSYASTKCFSLYVLYVHSADWCFSSYSSFFFFSSALNILNNSFISAWMFSARDCSHSLLKVRQSGPENYISIFHTSHLYTLSFTYFLIVLVSPDNFDFNAFPK